MSFKWSTQRDRTGREVGFFHQRTNVECGKFASLQGVFYLTMAALQDIETQRRGLVM